MAYRYKSKCLDCGKEWNYTRTDLTHSYKNHYANELKRKLKDGVSVFGINKFTETIDNIKELPEEAHQCPSCGSRNVSLEIISGGASKLSSNNINNNSNDTMKIKADSISEKTKNISSKSVNNSSSETDSTSKVSKNSKPQVKKDNIKVKPNHKMIKFIIISSFILVFAITISICTTVLLYKNMNSDNEVPVDDTPIPTVDTEQTPSAHEVPKEKPKTETYIIGSDKEAVRNIFNGYKEKTSIMGENAIDFDSDNLLVTVFFNNNKADGVIFLSNNLDSMDTITGEGSYVSQHYEELVKMATNDTNVKIESDLTKFNSQGNKKVVSELYIGNTPYADKNQSTSSTTSNTTQSNTKTSEDKEKSEFSYCLESGIVTGVKIYLKPNNESYVGTITAFSDEIYNEKGKKEKGVYLSGGSNDGWYKRSEIKKCYVRKDDPNLPSTRLIDKY